MQRFDSSSIDLGQTPLLTGHPSLNIDTPFSMRASESVSSGHPDKICDQISDMLLDKALAQNPYAHVAIEAMVTDNRVILGGEVQGVSLPASDVESAVRSLIHDLGYDDWGFDSRSIHIHNFIHEQSHDIARGVGEGDDKDAGAGDQGLMFGYACDETPEYMPAALLYAHRLLRNISEKRTTQLSGLGPDAKSQVIVKYFDDSPVGIDAVVISTQHHEDLSLDDVSELVIPVVESTIPKVWHEGLGSIFINPTGRFVLGGPVADTGLTGRKIIVDTYGGAAPHGGGAFSGKDPTKVDRSAAYMMRYLAKNIVASGLCRRCTVHVSYVIGRSQPLSLNVHTHGTSRVKKEVLLRAILQNFDLSPRGIRHHLKLNRPIYQKTASFGHFGRTYDPKTGHFSWENVDAVSVFQDL